MDIEATNRCRVSEALEDHFDVWQEVSVNTRFGRLRADIVARCRTGDLKGAVIGFEVKSGTEALNFQNWAKAFKQAADYVGGEVDLSGDEQQSIRAMFVFPSPPYVPFPLGPNDPPPERQAWFRDEQLLQYAGVIHLALHFRVGWARFLGLGSHESLSLYMGPNPIWDQTTSWSKSGHDLLKSQRVGSQLKNL